MSSIWKDYNHRSPNKDTTIKKDLKEDSQVEIAIIGAGMVGILTSYLLKQRGIPSIILERNTVASGQTGNTTAKITSGHNLIYHKLIKNFNTDIARLYATANEQALHMYQDIIKKENINCHYNTLPNYIYTMNNPNKIEKEVDACKLIGLDASYTTDTLLPFEVAASIQLLNQGQFNPMEFINGIIPYLDIYENTMVKAIEDNLIITNQGNIKANKIVMATHYPFINSPGYYFLRQHQERSYVIALKNAGILDGMYIDESSTGNSFRNYEDLLLLGGANHRTGENTLGGSYESLRRVAETYYPLSFETHHWSAQDAMTLDSIPYIGPYCNRTPNLFVATGFNKWGMTNSMISANLISDLIENKTNPFEEVYSPKRFKITASMMNLMEDGKQSITGLIKQHFSMPDTLLDDILVGHGGIIEYEGQKVGVYKDPKGIVHMVTTKCTHLGCNLEWNPDELSWDCPCHGSRFDYDGNLLDTPAIETLANSQSDL